MVVFEVYAGHIGRKAGGNCRKMICKTRPVTVRTVQSSAGELTFSAASTMTVVEALCAITHRIACKHREVVDLQTSTSPPRTAAPRKRSASHLVESALEAALEAVRGLQQAARDVERQCAEAMEAADEHMRGSQKQKSALASDCSAPRVECITEQAAASSLGHAQSPSSEAITLLSEHQLTSFIKFCEDNPQYLHHSNQAYIWEFLDWAVAEKKRRASKVVECVISNPHHLECVVDQLGADYLAVSRLSRTCHNMHQEVEKAKITKSYAASKSAQLGDGVRSVRKAAAAALGVLGEHAAPHAGAIGALLGDGDQEVRDAAEEALGKLGKHAAAGLIMLLGVTEGRDTEVARRWEAVLGLEPILWHR